VCLLLACAKATAQGPAPSVDEARALFTEGLEFVEQGAWIEAEDRFRRVLALRSSHVASYNLASALVHLGRLVEAAELLRAILRAPDIDAVTRDAAQQLLGETEPRIGSLTIRVAGDMTGVQFALDGKPIELSAQVQTLSVDPGQHAVSARRGDSLLDQGSVVVGGAAYLQAELSLELPPAIDPRRVARSERGREGGDAGRVGGEARAITAPAPTRADEADRGGTPVWIWAASGVAVAAATAVAIVLVAAGGEATPVRGDTDPPLVRGRVR
jgi:tetratricopeptide (TPR) repeat protein